MLMWIIKNFYSLDPFLYKLTYVAFRATSSLFTSFFFTLIITPKIINLLNKLQIKQKTRKTNPKSYLKKSKTPTMGGVIIILSIIISIILWADLSNPYIWYISIILIGYGFIGFIDDYLKITNNNSNGLQAKYKYLFLSIIAIIVISVMWYTEKNNFTLFWLFPNFKNFVSELGIDYIMLSYLSIVGTSNAVNLTDGLDGLAIVPIIFLSTGFAYIAWLSGIPNINHLRHVCYLENAKEIIIICNILIGSGLGFLWFNTYPAQIFMGDTGALALGGTLGIIGVLLRQEHLLIIIGGVFVLETISVIMQIVIYRFTKKKLFKMAPIHHHYEFNGCPEPKISIRFWIISLLLLLIGCIFLY